MRRTVVSGALALGIVLSALTAVWTPAAAAAMNCQTTSDGAVVTFDFTGNGDSFIGGTFGGWSIDRRAVFSPDAFSTVRFKIDKVTKVGKAKLVDTGHILRDGGPIKANRGLHLVGTPSAFTVNGKLSDRTNHSSVSVPSGTSGSCR